MKTLIYKLSEGNNLTPEEAEYAMKEMMSGNTTNAQIGAFLTALRIKGETSAEIASFARTMRKFAENIHPKNYVVDSCGTGGDRLNTYNISTTAMFIISGAGISVAKHGNRAVTSKSGSADVLEALGVKIDLEPKNVEKCINEIGIGFMFAPNFHKAMKFVMPARKEIGIKTVFNILGPLTNPANAKGQVVGVYSEELTEKICEVLKILELEKAFVVCGNGMDEISTLGKTKISELKDGEIKTYYVHPNEFGIKTQTIEELKGGDAKENAEILRKILLGEKTNKRDIAILNAAAGIVVGKKADNIKEGIEIAKESIASGKAYKKMEEMIKYTNSVQKEK